MTMFMPKINQAARSFLPRLRGILALAFLFGVSVKCLVPDATAGIIAFGGDITNFIDNYRIHIFTNVTANYTFEIIREGDLDALILAGGGGGGGCYMGGGGGAGGCILLNGANYSVGSYSITIGDGGAGGAGASQRGVNGQNTIFDVHTALGGGGGGSYSGGTVKQGLPGGCGGGASGYGTAATDAGAGTSGQGQPGAYGAGYGGGGGGGTAFPGVPGTSVDGGGGGRGVYSFISGIPAYYGGGGGGAAYTGVGGPGGGGGGGEGEGRNTSYAAMPGEPNTGGGGGGANGYKGTGRGAAGGSGIVIIRYIVDVPYTVSYPAGEITETTAEVRVDVVIAGITESTLTVFWDTVDHGPVPEDWPNSASITTDQAGVFSYTITGLSPDTEYHYIWRAGNEYGAWFLPESQQFRTRGKYYYVDPEITDSGDGSKWSAAFKTIQEAFDASVCGETIYLAGRNFALESFLVLTGQHVAVSGGYRAQGDASLPGPQDPLTWPTSISRASTPHHRLLRVTGAHGAGFQDIDFTAGSPINEHGGAILLEDSFDVHMQGCKMVANEVSADDGNNYYGAALAALHSSVRFDYCLIADNIAGDALYVTNGLFDFRNCTIVNNPDIGIRVHGGDVLMNNSIVWGSMPGIAGIIPNEMDVYEGIWYSCICDGKNSGVQGCISRTPRFVGNGDYHLASVMGHWANGSWVKDDVNSPCIDAGDPLADASKEPQPNGGRLNMGVYGNTPQASKSYVGPEMLLPVTSVTNSMLYSFSPPSREFYIAATSAWDRSLAFDIASDAPWLDVSEHSGVVAQGASKAIQALFQTDALPVGLHTATLYVTSRDAVTGLPATNSQQVVAASMTVLPPPGIFALPGALTNEIEVGNNASSQNILISNNSPWFACATFNQTEDAWLAVTPQTNRLAPGESATLRVDYSTFLLERGTYDSAVVVEGTVEEFEIPTDNILTLPVRMVVKHTPPRLSVAPAVFNISVQRGTHAPNAIISVWNSGSANNMPFGVEVNVPWLIVNPPQSSSTGQVQELLINFDTASLPVGNHSASLKVTARDVLTDEPALNSPWSVAVNLNVYPPGGGLTNLAIRASQGVHGDRVEVDWDGTPAAAWYEIWRNDSPDLSRAQKLADLMTLSYSDPAVVPGLKYSYWVRALDIAGIAGPFSSNAVGWITLAPPATVMATSGMFANKIKVEWSAAESADSYEVWRNATPVLSGAVSVFTTADCLFEDSKIEPGVTYYYWIRSMRSVVASPFSAYSSGYAMSKPSGLVASKGDFDDRIHITWNPAPGATTYEVWRSHTEQLGAAIRMAEIPWPEIIDWGAQTGRVYSYWVRSLNPGAQSALSAPDQGYRSTAQADLEITSFVWLPGILAPGQAPEIVNWTFRNHGPATMSGSNTSVSISLWASNRQTSAGTQLATWQKDITLKSGESILMSPTAPEQSRLASLPAGEYDLFLQVRHKLPSTLGDGNSGNNVARRAGPVIVRPGPAAGYLVKNDYNADGRSDLAVVHRDTGEWFVRGLDGKILIWSQPWGGLGLTPASGDFDGDRISDLAVYFEPDGRWFVYSTRSESVLIWNEYWGGPGYKPVWGVFDGGTRARPTVYNPETGDWYISDFVFGLLWGGAGYEAVIGDFDGDARSDFAVYDREYGRWFVRNAADELLLWSEPWGGVGYEPVAGDFDGDGKWDLAVYDTLSGAWYIKSMTGEILAWGLQWGGYGMTPVAGDFDGDGRWDMAVYQEATGAWYIWSLTQGPLMLGELWGGPGFEAIP